MRRGNRRRGGTMVESAVVLSLLVVLVVGTIDLGVAVFRKQVLSSASRHGARQAAVHGSMASVLGVWGPATYGPVALSTAAPIPDAIRPQVAGLNPADVTVMVEWPDGVNEPGSRVRVTLETTYEPASSRLIGLAPMRLTTVSTMPISH